MSVTVPVVIAGPTASGKSQLALRLAEKLAEVRLGARIINADSMQVYRELRIVTARPTPADEARAPHRLYGVLSAAEVCSAGRWREMAVAEIDAARRDGVVPIVVGGTGLYLRVLTQGLSPVPAIPEDVRAKARERMRALGVEAFRGELAARDAGSVAAMRPNDSQRLVRAWEVLEATGVPLHEWQRREPASGGLPDALKFVVLPERASVHAAIDARAHRMVADGVYDEVAAFDALRLADDVPVSRAVGVREFLAWVRGESTQEEAIALVQAATRQYAKRQFTWFRGQGADFRPVGQGGAVTDPQYPESLLAEIFPFIRESVLTQRGAAD